jgi:hypothetical protein
MESFIVRIYRQEKDNPENLVGTIEHVDSGSKKAFKQIKELWETLNNTKEKAKKNNEN